MKLTREHLYKIVPAGIFLLVLLGWLFIIPSLQPAGINDLDSCLESKGMGNGSFEERATQAAKFGIFDYEDTEEKAKALTELLCAEDGDLGFSVVTDFQKQLSAPMTSSQTFIPLSNLALTGESDTDCGAGGNCLDVSALGGEIFVTIDPGKSKIELARCTGSSTSTNRLTGCTRGLAFSGASTASVVARRNKHSAGASVVVSNVHYVYERFLDRTGKGGTTQTLTGDFTTTGTFTNAVTDGNFYLGDDTTGADKSFLARNGEANYPFLRYDESENKWVFSDDGVNTINLATSTASGLSASTTAGIGITNSEIYVNASSTDSSSGGFLDFSAGKLFWDVTAFLAKAWTWGGTQTFDAFAGTSTVDTLQITGSAGTANDAVNYSSAQTLIGQSAQSGTAGATVVAGDALYIASSGKLLLADPAFPGSSQNFVGIALTGGNDTDAIQFIPSGGVYTTSGLTAGSVYYLSGTAGNITATRPSAPDLPVEIGRALTTTTLLVKEPTVNLRASGSFSGTSPQNVNIGVIPERIDVFCGNEGSDDVSNGWWVWDRFNGTSSTVSWGVDDDSVPYTQFNDGFVCQWEEGSNTFSLYASTTPGELEIDLVPAGAWTGTGRDARWTAVYMYP